MSSTGRHGRIGASVAATLLLASTQLLAQNAEAAAVKFNIESQPLAQALNTWADQAGLQIIWPVGDPVAYQSSPAVRGRLEPMEALRLLLEDTGLTYSLISSGRTVAILGRERTAGLRTSANETTGEPGAAMTRRVDVAAQTGASSTEAAPRPNSGSQATAPFDRDVGEVESLEEVVVTGTHIRGITPDSSPLVVLNREDIDRAGVSTTAQLMRKIPQNFAVLDGETYFNNGTGGDQGNNTRGATVDLRGLGPGSTLILINGRRLSPAGALGSFVDVSMIPVSAIDRIEVLADGGSALYGADGVAGVVNLVLRRDFNGAETGIRYGDTTDGGADEFAVSQLLGGSWETGNALAVYEYSDQGQLLTEQRAFIAPQAAKFDIVPAQRRQSVVFSGRQSIVDGVSLFGDMLYSDREFRQDFSIFSPFFNREHGTARSTAGALGMDYEFATGWRAELVGSVSQTKERRLGSLSDGIDVFPYEFETESQLSSVEAVADGPLVSIAGGQVRGSIGVAARKDKFSNLVDPEFSRDARAAFGELFIPLIGELNQRAALRRLELSLAVRYDRYDDVGTSTNPRFGMLWSPYPGLNLRGTYTTSYRVPPLSHLAPVHDYQVLAIENAADTDASTVTLYPSLPQNPRLKPETAQSYTLGLDWKPSWANGWEFSLTYFDIDYRDRIAQPGDGVDVTQLFARPDLFAPFIDTSPDTAEVERIFAEENIEDFVGGATPDAVEAFANLALQNIATTTNSGFDLSATFAAETAIGRVETFFAGTYITDLRYQSVRGAPEIDRVDTIFQPVDFRARGGLSWSRSQLSSTLTLNYTDSYTNNGLAPIQHISSWITADWQIAFTGRTEAEGFWSGVSAALDVQNITNERPPQISTAPPALNLGFDSTNASPLGRLISLQVRKRW